MIRSSEAGRLLVVDDNRVNRMVLERALARLGHQTVAAEDGLVALQLLATERIDAVLLDVEMPELDGYATLQRIKGDPAIAHIPVIMVSGVEEIESVVRCIELGAVDYLPKPFDPAVLRARVDAALVAKRTRDRELDVLEQVERLVAAAAAVEDDAFDPALLEEVTRRDDAIGTLARVFNTMGHKVVEREHRLRRQIEQLRADAATARDDASPLVRAGSYVAADRLHTLVAGESLASTSSGAVLLADVTGFTAAVVERSRALGSDRGAEDLLRDLNGFYERIVTEIHEYGGAVVGYAGDGISSWFDDRDGAVDALGAAAAAGTALQRAADEFTTFAGLKVALAHGRCRRFAVGDPEVQLIDVLCGAAVTEAAVLERWARPGEVIVRAAVADALADRASALRIDDDRAVLDLAVVVAVDNPDEHVRPWPDITAELLTTDMVRPWLLDEVFDQVASGFGGLVAELRDATALFVAVDGLSFADPDAPERVDAVVRWIQSVLRTHGGSLIQLTPTAEGGYVYACFGALRSLNDDAVAAIGAATELQRPPSSLHLDPLRIGLARGAMRVGGYGGSAHRTYGAIGEQTNLAARLMQLAAPGEVLSDVSVAGSPGSGATSIGARNLKGVADPVEVFRHPTASTAAERYDALDPTLASLVKLVSIFPDAFDVDLVAALDPRIEGERDVDTVLGELCELGILAAEANQFRFADPAVRVLAHGRLLYAQRRTLHRQAREALVARGVPARADEVAWLRSLADHAGQADDVDDAVAHLEAAAAVAASQGRSGEALALLERSLRLTTS